MANTKTTSTQNESEVKVMAAAEGTKQGLASIGIEVKVNSVAMNVLHLSEITRFSNRQILNHLVCIVLHLSEITRFSN